MYAFWGSVALLFVFFFDSSAYAIQCAQGGRSNAGGVETNPIRNAECVDPTHVCHRIEFSISAGGVNSKNYFYSDALIE